MSETTITTRFREKFINSDHLRERFREGSGFASYDQALKWLRSVPDSYVTGPEGETDDDDWITVGCPAGSRAVPFDADFRGDDRELARRAAVLDACNQLYRLLHGLDDD